MPLLTAYDVDARRTKPVSVLAGNNTELGVGNGMAIDSDGSAYVIVYANASTKSPLHFLAFEPNARGNVAPERLTTLQGGLLAGYAVGLALDGHGNFWISDIDKLMRYPLLAGKKAMPNGSIRLELQTPDGLLSAHSANVATDSLGNVYCACSVVYRGNQASGVSEYAEAAKGKFRLVRSFYDTNLPDVPASTIAVDHSGTIYLASTLPNTGIFANRAGRQSGLVHDWRHFISDSATITYSLTTDSAGRVYAAAPGSIIVFGPHANGLVRPERTIDDPRHIDYSGNDYGTLLSLY